MNYAALEALEQESRDKRYARAAVARALKAGSLTKEPCMCGSEQVQAHHGDYKHPLDVIWLCSKHHAEVHSVRNRAERELDEIVIPNFRSY